MKSDYVSMEYVSNNEYTTTRHLGPHPICNMSNKLMIIVHQVACSKFHFWVPQYIAGKWVAYPLFGRRSCLVLPGKGDSFPTVLMKEQNILPSFVYSRFIFLDVA